MLRIVPLNICYNTIIYKIKEWINIHFNSEEAKPPSLIVKKEGLHTIVEGTYAKQKLNVGIIAFYCNYGEGIPDIIWNIPFMTPVNWLLLGTPSNLQKLGKLWALHGRLIPEPGSELYLLLKEGNRMIDTISDADCKAAVEMIEAELNRNNCSLDFLR